MKQTPAKKPRTKAPKVTPAGPPPAEHTQQPQQQITPIDIMRGAVQQFDKLQQEHAKLVEQYTIVAYALAMHSMINGNIAVIESEFREVLAENRVTVNPIIEDGTVTIGTWLQPL